MFQIKTKITLLGSLLVGCISIPHILFSAPKLMSATPANSSAKPTDAERNKAIECKAFTEIVNKASGARNTTDISVALPYVSTLKQDLLSLKVEDRQLKSLYDRYLPFAVEMEAKLEKVKREQAQGDYSALLAAVPSLTATGNRGIDLEQELLQYCEKP